MGIDLILMTDFEKRFSDKEKLRRVLGEKELVGKMESLAGRVAVKEALVKTGYLKVGEWLKVQIMNDELGAPYAIGQYGERIKGVTISIAHAGDYVTAVAIYEEDKNN